VSSRPSDFHDGGAFDANPDREPDSPAGPGAGDVAGGRPVAQPKLNPTGYLRFFWRQLTSMRTALALLLLLALAAVPGSLVPQRSSDPNGVIQYQRDNPELFDVLDRLGVFSTFSSPWFSAIYLLLFISLVGCIIPRTRHHLDALRATPPKTPVRLDRLVGFTTRSTAADAEAALEAGRVVLRRQGYRVARYDGTARVPFASLSAERGYLRETGNLLFHSALVGVLVFVGIGSGFSYTGQRVLIQDTAFTNSLASYDSFNPGRFFDESQLAPFSLRLDDFDPLYQFDAESVSWKPLDFEATLSSRTQGGDWQQQALKVNAPLSIGGAQVFLLGNGYAPELTIRNADGEVVSSGPTPFRPQDANLFSLGVVKVPDGLTATDGTATQLGFIGLLYPDPVTTGSGALASFSPEASDPILTLEVYQGDLGLDEGVAVNVYDLDTDDLTGLATRGDGLQLTQGETVDLPNGLGTVEFTGLRRFVAVDIARDPTQLGVLISAILVLGGLLLSLFVPRRRVWIKAVPDGDGVRLEYAGLARGEDQGLERAVAELADRHRQALGDPPPDGPSDAPSDDLSDDPDADPGART
jgi:cytochrome c biogenesis protein